VEIFDNFREGRFGSHFLDDAGRDVYHFFDSSVRERVLLANPEKGCKNKTNAA